MTETIDPQNQPAQTPPPPPKKKRRRWPWVILTIVLLLMLLVLLAPTIISTGPVKSIVVSKINNNLNGTLAVSDWSIGWTSGVTLNGIKVDDERGRRIVEVSSIRVPVSLIAAARGNYDLGDTIIDKPNLVNFEVYEDGSNNLQKLGKPSSPEEKTPHGKKESKLPDV